MGWFDDFLNDDADIRCRDEVVYKAVMQRCKELGLTMADGQEPNTRPYIKGDCMVCIDKRIIVMYTPYKGLNRHVIPVSQDMIDELEE